MSFADSFMVAMTSTINGLVKIIFNSVDVVSNSVGGFTTTTEDNQAKVLTYLVVGFLITVFIVWWLFDPAFPIKIFMWWVDRLGVVT